MTKGKGKGKGKEGEGEGKGKGKGKGKGREGHALGGRLCVSSRVVWSEEGAGGIFFGLVWLGLAWLGLFERLRERWYGWYGWAGVGDGDGDGEGGSGVLLYWQCKLGLGGDFAFCF